MEQQNNKNHLVGMDVELLTPVEIEHLKSIPTNIHVVYSKIYNKVLLQKNNTVFTTEDEAGQYAETLAVSVSGLTLNFWEYSFSEVATKYVIEDFEEIGIIHRITIYPKNNS